MAMNAHVSGITLGVKDVERSKRFYAEGLGWPIAQEQGPWVAFSINGGTSVFGLLALEALAGDTGVPADGDGSRGLTFSYVVPTQERVDAVLAEAERAGGTIAKPATAEPWGGYGGYFADPDGYLWKVATGAGEQPFAAE
jgi:catechol 2,3-dioxygenase-like lactoylglutathione lyase family enzyme